jgi:hypothetical protein
MSGRGEKLVGPLLEALASSVDRARFGRSLDQLLGDPSGSPAKTSSAVAHRIVLSDILDDAILSSRPGETSFPLRMFFGSLGDGLDDDTTFALANGLNFYFRAAMDEEAKMHVGLEVSRLYYRFVDERKLERDVVVSLSPLLARLMSTELERIRLEAIDGARTFDSSVHERVPGSDATSPKIAAPKSFLCRVVSSSMVRAKAQVRT